MFESDQRKELASRGSYDLPALNLPTDFPRSPVQSYRGGLHSFAIDADLTRTLTDLSAGHNVPVYITLLSAFQVLLFRYTGQTDLVLGVVVNDDWPESALFVFRNQVTDNLLFSKLASQTQQTIGNADHNSDQLPSVQVVFSFQHAEIAPDLQPDLALAINHEQNQLIATLCYNRDLFEAATIRRMSDHLQTLLAAIVTQTDSPIGELPLLTKAERRQILIDWNATSQAYPDNICIHEWFEAQVARRPDATALCFDNTCLTYAELNERANQLAHYLQRLGIGPEKLVGICLERSLELIIGILGVFKSGGAYVPIDPNYPRERLAYMLEDAQVPVLLTQKHLVEILPTSDANIVCLDAGWLRIAEESSENCVSGAVAQNLAYMIYTSGSTGKPKGVLVQHQGLCNLTQSEIEVNDCHADSRVLQYSSISFDGSIDEICMALVSGAALCVAPPQVLLGAELVDLLREQAITITLLPPSATASVSPDGLSLLKTVNVGGEACTEDIVARWAPNRRFVNAYGLTETTVCATVAFCQPDGRRPSIGRPIANAQVYLLDSQLQPVPIGVAAEMYIGGAGLARGYRNRPDLTAERFIPNPFSATPGARLYKTGDLARYLPDGSLDYLGRIDQQVKVRGYRIEPGEIEAALRQHEAVHDALVLLRDERLVAYIVKNQEPRIKNQDAGLDGSGSPSGNAALGSADLRAFLREQLPEYMVPSAFVLLDAWPLTPNDKIDRQALPAPDPAQFMETRELVAPRTPTEELLAGIWASTLGLEQISIHDHFFELGGHSLLATQVISRVRQTLQVELPLHRFFAAPTVAELAAAIEATGQISQESSTPIPRAKRPGDLPLSFAQRRLWFLDQLEKNSPAYNIPLAMRLAGALDLDALEQSLNLIVQRHESLRTIFAAKDGEPVQVILPELRLDLAVVDLQALPAPKREAELLRLVNEDAQEPFDLACGPLIRAAVLRLGPADHALLLNLHHIIADGWSFGVLLAELETLYRAVVAGSDRQPEALLPALPIQYADYALWQQSWIQGEQLERQLAYWRQHLDGAPTVLDLPTDRPRPPIQTFRGARHTLNLPRSLVDTLDQFNRREGVTLFMTLFAAFQTLLHRYTGLDDLLVGVPIANRTRAETEPLIGFFVNTLALRADLSGNPTFRDLLARVRETALSAYNHQDLPFDLLVQALQPERNLSHTPLIQVMFVLQNTPLAELALPGLTIAPVEEDGSSVRFDLTLDITETADGLIASFKYNTDLFDATTIEQMAGHYQTLLESAITDPTQRLDDLPLLTAAERQQILVDWNATRVKFPEAACIHALIEAQAQRRPNTIAVVFEDTEITYAELNRRANQLAHALQALGVGPEVRVGLCLPRSIDLVVALLGVLKAGGAYVPIDPGYPAERIQYVLNDAHAAALLTRSALLPDLPAHGGVTLCLDREWPTITQQPPEAPRAMVGPGNLAYVLYTSGSTGRPKGVQITHGSLANFLQSMRYEPGLRDDDVVLALTTIAFDIAALELWLPLLVGARIVLIDRDTAMDGARLSAVLASSGATVLQATPATWRLLLAAGWDGTPGLRALCGGEALPWDLAAALLDRVNALWNLYGPTETTVWSAATEVRREEGRATLGRPIANTQLYVLDGQIQPVPPGVAGELYIGGDGLARGYLNRPDLTAERFLPDPFRGTTGARLYRTGDVVRYRFDGALEFLGRADAQVKVRGFRIELAEIEAALLVAPGVREGVVVARSDTTGTQYLAAYVVPQPDVTLSVQELRSALREQLPDYMIPAAFVTLDALPLTPNGKIDRRRLPEADAQHIERGTTVVAPRDRLELSLAQIWEELLNISPISVTDNFFELGGHSLLAVRLMSKIRDRLGQQLPLTALFQGATIQDLAARLRQHSPDAEPSSLVALQPQGSLPPFFCVHPVSGNVMCYIDLARRLRADRPFYALQAPGLDHNRQPLASLEDLAAHYLQELCRVQPDGPYLLGGWSMGGNVAFEMARQLRARGVQSVELLLIDSFVSACGSAGSANDRELEAIGFGEALGLEPEDLDSEKLAQLSPEQQLAHIVEQAQQARLLTPDMDLAQIRRLFGVYQANVRLLRSYELRPYPGRITLLKASQQPPDDDSSLGWERLAAGGVITDVVPGTHFSLIKRPHVEALAERLQQWLDQNKEQRTREQGN